LTAGTPPLGIYPESVVALPEEKSRESFKMGGITAEIWIVTDRPETEFWAYKQAAAAISDIRATIRSIDRLVDRHIVLISIDKECLDAIPTDDL
jgi:hypothetical protein